MSSEVQLSGNEMLNKKVLSSRRKVRSDEAVRRDTSRVFHARVLATGNARLPRLDRLVTGRNKVDVEPDLRRRHASILDVKCSVSARYDGALPYYYDILKHGVLLHYKLSKAKTRLAFCMRRSRTAAINLRPDRISSRKASSWLSSLTESNTQHSISRA